MAWVGWQIIYVSFNSRNHKEKYNDFSHKENKESKKKTGVNFYNSFRFFCDNYFLFMVLSDHKNVETELLHGYALRR
jgi:coproporphyrinogen III oxidase